MAFAELLELRRRGYDSNRPQIAQLPEVQNELSLSEEDLRTRYLAGGL